jgi:hypothetical protein
MSALADFEVQQEDDVVASRYLGVVGVVSILCGAAGVFLSSLLLIAGSGALQPSAAGRQGPRTAPREIAGLEQTLLSEERAGVDRRESQRRELARWGWVDRRAGVARVPIDRAIGVVVAEESR